MKLYVAPLVAALVVSTGCQSLGPDDPAVTPQRPRPNSSFAPTTSGSHNTRTTYAGTLELEAGVAIDPKDRFDTPGTLKYGASEDTEVSIGWSPIVQDRHGPTTETGIGDVRLRARHRFRDADASSDGIAMAAGAELKLPTAKVGVGTGQPDVLFSYAADKQVGSLDITGFYRLGVLSAVGRQGTDVSHDLTIFGQYPVADRVAIFSEIGGTFIPARTDFDSGGLFSLGAYYTLAPALVFDAAVSTKLGGDIYSDFALLAGLTTNFGGRSATPQQPRGW